jgi:hypothetical protein
LGLRRLGDLRHTMPHWHSHWTRKAVQGW